MLALSDTRAIVLFSGGQDSAACLAHALNAYAQVETLGFDYGQRHSVELAQRAAVRDAMAAAFPEWAARLGPDTLLDLTSFGAIGETALTADVEIAMGESGLPTTFVPGRNLAFLVYAAAHAYRRGAGVLVAGMCETDYSGYPDCRAETLDAMEAALRLGLDADLKLDTPLMHLTKAQTWAFSEKLGGAALVDLILEHSHTCYRGDRSKRHAWGYGCGACPACELRAKGYATYIADKGAAP
ncbi:MAG: 7-cyano-7-deazaguanine synthase QueC [Pseudomonadota bacterium]